MLVVIGVAVLFTILGISLAYVIALVNTKYPLLKPKQRDAVAAPALLCGNDNEILTQRLMPFGKQGKKTDLSKVYEETTKARLIVINHNHGESMYGIIGMPSSLSIADASKLQKILESTPDEQTIHLVLRSQGGSLQATEIILNALKNRKGEVHVFVPEYAQSAATMIALAGTHLHMGKNAFLTAVDPQISIFSAYTIVDFVKNIQANESGMIVTLAKLIRPAAEGAIARAEALLTKTLPNVPSVLKGSLGHDKPLFVADIEKIRKVQVGIPEDLQKLLNQLSEPNRYGF